MGIRHCITDTLLPFSIILDGSTDRNSVHYLIVYFQFIYEDVCYLQFYRLIPIGSDESAKGLYNVLMDKIRFEKEDLFNHMKKNIVGFISDGASVMMGRKNGLVILVGDFTGRPIFRVHCMAHRLHLVITQLIHC